MSGVYIVVIAICVIYGVLKEKNLFSPGVVFSFIWLLVGILSLLQLYGLSETSDRAYLTALIGVVCFVAGCAIRNRLAFKSKTIFGNTNKHEYNRIRYVFLICLLTVIVIFTFFNFIKAVVLLKSGVSMETIRFNYRNLESGIIIKSALAYDIENYIVAPTEFVAVVLFPIVLLDKKCLKKYILLFEITAFLCMHIFVTGARSFLIDVLIVMVFYVLINEKYRSKFKEYFKRISRIVFILVGIAALAIIIAMTIMRKNDKPLLKEIYMYFAIPFPLLDTHLSLMDATPDFTYGMTLLQGWLRPIVLILKVIGISLPMYNHARDLVSLNDTYYQVSSGGKGNSFVTVFYYFYMDFGIIAVIIGSLLYGFISQSFYIGFKRVPDRRRQAMYLLIVLGLFLSFSRLQFTAYKYCYAFILLLLCFGKTKDASEINNQTDIG